MTGKFLTRNVGDRSFLLLFEALSLLLGLRLLGYILVHESYELLIGFLESSVPVGIVARARFALELIFLLFGRKFE